MRCSQHVCQQLVSAHKAVRLSSAAQVGGGVQLGWSPAPGGRALPADREHGACVLCLLLSPHLPSYLTSTL